MKTTILELPTMISPRQMKEVSEALNELNIAGITAVKGRLNLIYNEALKKVEIIKAIEEAGYIVVY